MVGVTTLANPERLRKEECVRKVVVYMLVSLDGVAQDPETFLFDFDETMEANLAQVTEAGSSDAVAAK